MGFGSTHSARKAGSGLAAESLGTVMRELRREQVCDWSGEAWSPLEVPLASPYELGTCDLCQFTGGFLQRAVGLGL